MNWLTSAGMFVAAVLGGGGFVAVINALSRRRTVKVDAADKLSDAAVDWATALKKDAGDARSEAREARREAAEAHTSASAARREADEATRKMHHVNEAMDAVVERMQQLTEAILSPEALDDPQATIERLQQMVRHPLRRPPMNGRI